MPEIQNPDLVQKIRRRFGLKGAAPISTVAPEIVPVSIVDQIETEPERRSCWAGFAMSSAAGQYVRIYLTNAAASGIIVELESLLLSGTGSAYEWGINITPLTTGTERPTYAVDMRLSGVYAGQRAAAKMYWESGVAAVSPSLDMGQCYLANNSALYTISLDGGILTPGSSFVIGGQETQKSLYWALHWFERAVRQEDRV